MGQHPLLSVAIPTRNYARFLPRALCSALRAGALLGVPFEIVVVDDASTDETREVLERFRLSYPSLIKAIYRPATRGVAVAKNSAIAHCSGRYIALLDADDEFFPEKLLRCFERLNAGEAEFVTHDFIHWLGPDKQQVANTETWSAVDIGFWPPSTWVFERGVVWHNEQMFLGNDDLEWLARRRATLRQIHLPLVLNTQYAHANNFGQRRDSLVPSIQVMGRMRGQPNSDDRRAPTVWECELCGRRTLLPATCCGQLAKSAPVYYYSIAESSTPAPEPPEFSFVFLTQNHSNLTQRAIESLLPKLQGTSAELIFIDGGSTDDTLDAVRSWSKQLPVKLVCVHPDEPFNYSRNCNRGTRAAVGKYVFLANNDIEFGSDALVPALRAALSDPRVGVVGVSTRWLDWHREPTWDTARFPYLFSQRPFPGYFWGTRREVYWELGGLDEAFSGYGYDELDFYYRALLRHYRLALVAGGVIHWGSMTFKTVHDTETMSELEQFNRTVFERKHGLDAYVLGDRVEPYASHKPPKLSIVMVARDAGNALRRSLEGVATEPEAHNGSTQLVVVNNGSQDETALVLAEQRRRLPRLVTVIEVGQAVATPRAVAMGRARAIGRQVLIREPGDTLPIAGAAR